MSEIHNNTQPANAQQNNQSGNDNAAGNSGQTSNAPTYTQEQLDSMVSAREQRAANSALKSFFSQQGMTEEEINKAISDYKTTREKNKPDINAITAQAEQYKAEAVKAKIESKATIEALKLGIDSSAIPYVMKLADFSAATNEKGEIDTEKIKTEIGKVLEDVPQLKKETKLIGFTKIGAGENKSAGNAEEDIIRKAFGLKPKK